MAQNKQETQARRAVAKSRLTNCPVIVLLVITLAVIVFYYDATAWREAFNPQVVKPLMAAASAVCLLLYFFIGSDGLKLLLAVHVLASIVIIAGMLIEWRTGVMDFVIEVVRRGVFVVILLCLYLWDKDREAKARSTRPTKQSEEGSVAASTQSA